MLYFDHVFSFSFFSCINSFSPFSNTKMPSWSVKENPSANGFESCTYYHYYGSRLDVDSSNNPTNLIVSLVKCLTTICFVFFFIDGIVSLFWSFVYWYFTSLYESNHFYFAQLSIRVIFLFIYSTVLTFVFFNNDTKYGPANSIKRISIISSTYY